MGPLSHPPTAALSTASMTPSISKEKQSIRPDARQKVVNLVSKAKASQPKVAIRTSSRLKKKEVLQNRSAVFPGTKAVSRHASSPSTVYLPDDVVINIFTIYLGLMENHHKGQHDSPGLRATPFFLASIAFAWSRIVRSTPSLWKNIDLCLDPRRYKRQVKLLGEWLDQTSGCELSVSVLTHLGNTHHWERRIPRSVYDVVETRAEQITDLSLPLFPNFYARKMSGFENLQRLRLDSGQQEFPDQHSDPVFEIDAPALAQLQTFAMSPSLVRVVDADGNEAALDSLKSLSTQIVCLHLTYGFLRDRQMRFDTQFNQLTHLDISGAFPLEQEAMPQDAPRLRLPELRYLRCNSFAHITSQIEYAPRLTTLVCFIPAIGIPSDEYLDDAVEFLQSVDCSHLQTFIVSSPLQIFYADEDDIASLLITQPDIRDVSIIGAADHGRVTSQYFSDVLLRAFGTPMSERILNIEERFLSTELIAPKLRSFTYCGPTDANNFTALSAFNSLTQRASLYPLRQVAKFPLEFFRIMSTNKILDYDDEIPAVEAAFTHLRKSLPTLSVSLAHETPIDQMYDAEKLWPPKSPKLKYISYCDRPHEVDPNESFDNKFFELRYVTPHSEQTTYL